MSKNTTFFGLSMAFCLLLCFDGWAQSTTISVHEDTLKKSKQIIDPARYQNLLFIKVGLSSSVSNKQKLNSWLTDQQQKISNNQSIGLNVSGEWIYKNHLVGLEASIDFPSNSSKTKVGLNTSHLLVSYGKTSIRSKQNVAGLKLNAGLQINTLQATETVLPYLNNLNLDHSIAKLRNSQIVLGPSFQLNRLLLGKKNYYRGKNISFEIGALYTPFAGAWKYGFTDDEDGQFIGITIDEISKTMRSFYFAKIKFGIWNEGYSLEN
jgi:hypothetical protein